MNWVTRERPKTDRIACPWLIRRFIDPDAEILYVSRDQVLAAAEREGARSFDAPDAEFTHRDGLCTFEVLLRSFEITDAALRPIAEIVHDIDLKVDTYGRPETKGFELFVNAIAMAHREDEDRLSRASAMLDDLYELYKRKRPDRGRAEDR